jgi:hypothetical protein
MTLNNQELRFLNEAFPQLQEYLLSNELYWPLSSSLPRLTPGSLLLALVCVQATSPMDAQRLDGQMEAIRAKKPTAWEKKVEREIKNRFRLWSQFLSDYKNAPDQNQDWYLGEIRGRAILQLLLVEHPEPVTPEKMALADLEKLLKIRLIPGKFLWEPELEPFFEKNEFWFLFGKL